MIYKYPYKTALSIILILSFNNSAYSLTSYIPSFSTKKALYGIAIVATTAALAKIVHSLYNHFFWAHKNLINHCRQLYKTIYTTLQTDKMLYFHIAQLSDWDLKEAIYTQKNEHLHPFMTYHTTLCQSIYAIEQHIANLLAELDTISLYKQQIMTGSIPGASDILEMLAQLEQKGLQLQLQLEQTKSTMSVLRGRIALFKEYNDDYQYWIYEQERKRQGLVEE